MMNNKFYALVAALLVATIDAGDVVSHRGRDGVNRYVLYRSRELAENECLPKCTETPTASPTTASPTPAPSTARPTDSPSSLPTVECCELCPPELQCVPQSEGGCICMACDCGFCDTKNWSCCAPNVGGTGSGRGNNCNRNVAANDARGDNKECQSQYNRWPHVAESGDICGGVEISATATPNGCGCKPNGYTQCSYDRWDTSLSSGTAAQCFICDVNDWAENTHCDDCKACIRGCDTGNGGNDCLTLVDGTDYADTDAKAVAYSDCFAKKGNTHPFDEACRGSCQDRCTKKVEDLPTFLFV